MPEAAPIDPLASAHCWSCGYPLRGVPSDRCPECGRPFDRADRTTANFGRPMGRLGRRALAGMSAWTVGVAIVGAGLVAATFRWPVEPVRPSWADLRYYGRVWEWKARPAGMTWVDGAYTAGLALVGIAIVAMFIRLVARGLAVWRYRPPAWQRGAVWRRVGVVVVAAIATVGVVSYGWPYRVGQRWAADADYEVLPRVNQGETSVAIAKRTISSAPLRPTVRVPDGGTLLLGSGPLVMPLLRGWPGLPGSDVLAGRSEAELLSAARALAVRGRRVRERTWGLKCLVERAPDLAGAFLPAAYAAESDPALKAHLLRMLAITQRAEHVPLARAALTDGRPEMRAAGADAIGLYRRVDGAERAREIRHDGQDLVARKYVDPLLLATDLATDPPIVNVLALYAQPAADRPQFPDDVRGVLEHMMTTGLTPAEREAAARVLVAWPAKGYRMRVAQWAVLLAGTTNRLRTAHEVRGQIDSIPPFVHRVGNPESEYFARLDTAPMTTWKPVVHFAVDRPTAVRFEVGFRGGRPWFAFPRPDDLAIVPSPADATTGKDLFAEPMGGDLDELGAVSYRALSDDLSVQLTTPGPGGAALTRLDVAGEGYPWLTPRHRAVVIGAPDGWTDLSKARRPGAHYHRGLVWQSLIVSPTKLPWMSPPAVPADDRFKWWNGLRAVNAAWVASRGEADRLLYFDGPVGGASPFTFARREDGTIVAAGRLADVVVIDGSAGKLRTAAVTLPTGRYAPGGSVIDLPGLPVAPDAKAAEQALLDLLVRRGLRPDEASGLVGAWRDVFYRPGHRALVFLSEQQYDHVFPHAITPAPTESVRVGIVVHEIGSGAAETRGWEKTRGQGEGETRGR
ncbi:MAG TPA: HEAT repeat domain-containing protein [Tepidisphaeraceae bacterium]|nr:HEAT repeat domain-containing protein [Tepidisphaeraceae bacterium]